MENTETSDLGIGDTESSHVNIGQNDNENLVSLLISPKAKKRKITGTSDLATELVSPEVQSTPKVAQGCKSATSLRSNVSKTLDFSHVSPQVAQSTRHEQSPEYLRGLTPVKRSLISKGSQFMKLTKHVKYAQKNQKPAS